MRLLLLLLVLIFSNPGNTQVLKKKYLGLYKGEIPSYALELGQEVFQVQALQVQVELKPDGVLIQRLASQETKGTYTVIKEDKNAIYFEGQFEGQFIPESFILYKSEKRLERKGIYPQPDSFLRKQ